MIKHSDIMEAINDKGTLHRYNNKLPLGRQRIGMILQSWAIGEGNTSALAKRFKVSESHISRLITKHYLRLRKSEETEVIVIRSKV